MDVDPTAETLLLTVNLEAPATVCLPYSLVPGIDTSSKSYQRAIVVLGKQQANLAPAPNKTPLVPFLDRGSL